MASHQQDHHDNVDQLKVCCCKGVVSSLLEENKKLKAELFEIKECSTNKVLEEKFEKMECSIIKKVQEMFLLNRPPSVLPSNASLLPYQPETSASMSYLLCFNYVGKFPDTFDTKTLIEDVVDLPKVELFDHTGKRVLEVGPEKDVKIKFLVLDGDLKDDFTDEDFNKYIVTPRNDKPALLKGNCEVSLSNNGSARVSGFSFTDNSNAMRNGRFRLGAQLTNGDRFGPIVRPAVSPPFKVKEKRPEDDQKHPTPSPTDELFHLRNIGKKGPYYKRALENEVKTVLDFLQLNNTDPGKLKTILGIKGAKAWKQTVDNAKESDLTNERYKYLYHDDASGDVLLLKCDFNIESVTFKGQISQPYESLNNSQKEKVVELRKAAFEKRKELIIKDCDSTIQTPEQQEPEEREQQQPEPAPSNMDPNVPYVVNLPDQIHSNPFTNTYLGTTVADHVSCQQDFMNASGSLITGDYGGDTASVANEYQIEQVGDNELDSYITASNQAEMDMQQMFSDPLTNLMPSEQLSDIGCEDFPYDDILNELLQKLIQERRWRKFRVLPLVLCRWKRCGAHCRPQKKQKI